MKKILKLRTVLASLAVLFIFVQVFRIDKTNPLTDDQSDFIIMTQPPQEIARLLKTGCYDCHSNESVYPWYSNIAPVSWILKSHVTEGRKHLNFSEWGSYPPGRRGHKLDASKEMLEKGEMPLKPYKFMHSDAKFSPEQKEELIKWLTVE